MVLVRLPIHRVSHTGRAGLSWGVGMILEVCGLGNTHKVGTRTQTWILLFPTMAKNKEIQGERVK